MMNELDMKLQQIASTDWEQFKKLIGEEAITKAKVCMLRGNKRSMRYVSYRLKISLKKTFTASQKCFCNGNGNN